MSGPHFGWSQCNAELAHKLSSARPLTGTAPTLPPIPSRPTESSLPPLPTAAAAAPREIPTVLMFQRPSASQPTLKSSPVRVSQPVPQSVEPQHQKSPLQKSSPEIHNMLSPLLDVPSSVVATNRKPQPQSQPQAQSEVSVRPHSQPTFIAEPWYPTAVAKPDTILSIPNTTHPNPPHIHPSFSSAQHTSPRHLAQPSTSHPSSYNTHSYNYNTSATKTPAGVFDQLQGGTGQAALALLPKTGPIVILMAVAAVVSVGWSVLSPRQRKIAGTVLGLVTTLLFCYGGPLLSYLPQPSAATRSKETAGDRYKNMPYRQPPGPQHGGPQLSGPPAGSNGVRPNMAGTPTFPQVPNGHPNNGNVSSFPQIPSRQPTQPPRPPQPNTHPQPVSENLVIQSPASDPLRPGYNSSVNRIVPSEISHFAAANLMGVSSETVATQPVVSSPTSVPVSAPTSVPVVSPQQDGGFLSYGYTSSPQPPSTPPSIPTPSPSYSSSASASVPPSPQYSMMPWYQTPSPPSDNGLGTVPSGSIMAVSPDSYRGTSSAPVGVQGVSGHGYNGMVPGHSQRPPREDWNDIPPYREAISPTSHGNSGPQPYYPVPPVHPVPPVSTAPPQPQGLQNFYIR